eukprot:3940479-Rhodomonas_salina.1
MLYKAWIYQAIFPRVLVVALDGRVYDGHMANSSITCALHRPDDPKVVADVLAGGVENTCPRARITQSRLLSEHAHSSAARHRDVVCSARGEHARCDGVPRSRLQATVIGGLHSSSP